LGPKASIPFFCCQRGPDQTGEPYTLGYAVQGSVGTFLPRQHRDDNDFTQAGDLFRLMGAEGQKRLIKSMSKPLSQVSLPGVVERIIGFMQQADPAYGKALSEAVAAQKK
jgi:catalase